jgi:hypothetical protein
MDNYGEKGEVNTRLDGHDNRLNQNESDIISNAAGISNLDTRVTQNEEDINGVQGRISAAVSNITVLKAIDTTSAEDYPDRVIINVEESGIYRLDRNSATSDNGDTVIAPTVGVGRWFRMARATVVKQNIDATTNPSVNDDSSSGYSIGSTWTNKTAKKRYYCTDSTIGAAVWELHRKWEDDQSGTYINPNNIQHISETDNPHDTNSNNLTDTDFSGITSGQISMWNGTQWINQDQPAGSFDGLSDTNFTSLSSGQVAVYNGVDWINQAAASGGKYRISITAGAWRYETSGYAPYETYIGTNQRFENNNFSGSLDQHIYREVLIPVGLTIPTTVDITVFYLATGTGFVDLDVDSFFINSGGDHDIVYAKNNSIGFTVSTANRVHAVKLTVNSADIGLVAGNVYGQLKFTRFGSTDANTGFCKINAILLEI